MKELEQIYRYDKSMYHLEIFENVTEIKPKKFRRKRAKILSLPNSLKIIGDSSFKENYLTRLNIPDEVEYIGNEAFQNNNLKEVVLGNRVRFLGTDSFSNNKIEKLKLNNNLKVIGNRAFYNNKIKYIFIPNCVEKIEVAAFLKNNIGKIDIPLNVKEIGANAFDSNVEVYYGSKYIPHELIIKLGFDNIIDIYNISKFIPIESLNVFTYNSFKLIPKDIESVKGFLSNYKKYLELINKHEIIISNYLEEEKDFFKLCYILGLFKGKNYELIDEILKNYKHNKNDFHQILTNVKLTKYKQGFEELFGLLYKQNKLEYNERNITSFLYNSYENIKDVTIKRHKELISNKNTEKLNAIKNGLDVTKIEDDLEKLKTNEKLITYEDICYFIENNTFEIHEGNDDLKPIFLELAIHMEQKDFEIIQEIYEKSKDVPKKILSTKDKVTDGITYKWLKSDDPQNIILGYLVNCCAKLYGAGQDIMFQSMINPNIANLVLYDENNNVLGKATAYYNEDKKYILFNNIEIKPIKAYGLKSEKQRKEEALLTLLRAVEDLVQNYKDNNIDLFDVRIGMSNNDLCSIILQHDIEINKKSLLENYKYSNYNGDANTPYGQAVLYKTLTKNKA